MTKKNSKNKQQFPKQLTSKNVLIALIGVLVGVVGTALTYNSFAAPPTKAGNGTITLSLPPVTDTNGDGLPNYGDSVRFNVATTATSQPWVNIRCYVNNVLVSQGYEGYFAGALDDGNFGLYSPQWTTGAADCTASLQYQSTKGKKDFINITSVAFHVNP